MIENCKQTCERCEHADHGVEDCHECFRISDRCPLYGLLQTFMKVNGYPSGAEWLIRYTGCIHFKEDLVYKKQQEDIEKLLEDINAERERKARESHAPV